MTPVPCARIMRSHLGHRAPSSRFPSTAPSATSCTRDLTSLAFCRISSRACHGMMLPGQGHAGLRTWLVPQPRSPRGDPALCGPVSIASGLALCEARYGLISTDRFSRPCSVLAARLFQQRMGHLVPAGVYRRCWQLVRAAAGARGQGQEETRLAGD